MVSTSASIALNLLAFLVLACAVSRAQPAASPPAPPGPINLTRILEKAGQYSSFIRLLQSTGVGDQLNTQLNDTYDGLTVFVPTDNAFNALPAGTLNRLSGQQQIEFVLFDVLPRFFSLVAFQTASNPLMTEASGKTGQWTLNVTVAAASGGQVNVSTGVVETRVTNAVYADFPLAVYSLEAVLLPYEIFGPQPPAEAPATAKKEASPPAATADAGSADAPLQAQSKSGAAGVKVEWGFVAGLGLLGIAADNNML